MKFIEAKIVNSYYPAYKQAVQTSDKNVRQKNKDYAFRSQFE